MDHQKPTILLIFGTLFLGGCGGLNLKDNESSDQPYISGAIFRSLITDPSNWRSEIDLDNFERSYFLAQFKLLQTLGLLNNSYLKLQQ